MNQQQAAAQEQQVSKTEAFFEKNKKSLIAAVVAVVVIAVGIILCKKADKAYVEYVLQDYVKPMGVATYRQMQNRLRELLPPEEEMKRLLSEKNTSKEDQQ